MKLDYNYIIQNYNFSEYELSKIQVNAGETH